MSGHSKWSQIKRKKGIKDAARGKLFSKISQLITLAVNSGGGIADPEKNSKLRLAIERAKSAGMPKENIVKAIERAKGKEGRSLKEAVYEGFAPHSVALIITAATNNPNRTFAEIRAVLEKHGGKLGSSNSIMHLFKKCGLVVFDKNAVTEEQVLLFADKIQAEDIEEDESFWTVYIPFEKIGTLSENLGQIKSAKSDIFYRPLSLVSISDENNAKNIIALVEALEDLDDVNNVYANFDIPESFLKNLKSE